MATATEYARCALNTHGSELKLEQVEIRPARLDDVGAIDALVQRAYEPYVGVLVLATMPDHVLIENVAVDTSRQGQGIGRSLLAFAEVHTVKRLEPGL